MKIWITQLHPGCQELDAKSVSNGAMLQKGYLLMMRKKKIRPLARFTECNRVR